MHWAEPKFLWALAILPLVALGLHWSSKSYLRRRQLAFGEQVASITGVKGTAWGSQLSLLFSIALLIVAAAGPRWSWQWVETDLSGSDIMVVLDVSRSMDVKDVDPSRMQVAKRYVQDLLQVAVGDRIGLTAFAGTSFVQCPLTSDKDAVAMFLDVIDTSLIPSQGSNPGGALTLAAKSLTSAAASSKSPKHILLLSDGEDLDVASEQSLKDALEILNSNHVKISSIGIGSIEGGPIPLKEGGYKRDQDGELVISRLNSEILQRVSKSSSGEYIQANSPNSNFEGLYKRQFLSTTEDAGASSKRQRIWFEKFQWFAGLGLVLLLLEILLFFKRMDVLFLVCFLLLIPARGEAKDFNRIYNSGVQELQKNNQTQALEHFEDVAQNAADPILRQKALGNVGVLREKLNDNEGAKKAYQDSLAIDPQDQQVRDNLRQLLRKDKFQGQDKQSSPSEPNQDSKNEGSSDKEKDQTGKDGKEGPKGDQKQPQKDDKKDNLGNKDRQGKGASEKQQGEEKQGTPKDQPGDPQGSGKSEQGKQGEMSEKDANRLLRMIPDDFGKFYHPPQEALKSTPSKQDW
jgi:Ca-activated chloride channel family protein